MTTALQAARERLERFVSTVDHPWAPIDPIVLQRLLDEVVIAARCAERPF